MAAFGYDDDVVGSHAGISDTSQMLHVYPAGVRKAQIVPWGGAKDSGVTGDPGATAEIGRMGIEFKVNAGISQYRLLKNPPQPPHAVAPFGVRFVLVRVLGSLILSQPEPRNSNLEPRPNLHLPQPQRPQQPAQHVLLVALVPPDFLTMAQRGVEHAPAPVALGPGER